jgi:hypothetical protein
VPMRPWPTVLVRLAIQQAAGDSTQARQMLAVLDQPLHQVRDGFDARPFGTPNRIAPAATGPLNYRSSPLFRPLFAQTLRLDPPSEVSLPGRVPVDGHYHQPQEPRHKF